MDVLYTGKRKLGSHNEYNANIDRQVLFSPTFIYPWWAAELFLFFRAQEGDVWFRAGTRSGVWGFGRVTLRTLYWTEM